MQITKVYQDGLLVDPSKLDAPVPAFLTAFKNLVGFSAAIGCEFPLATAYLDNLNTVASAPVVDVEKVKKDELVKVEQYCEHQMMNLFGDSTDSDDDVEEAENCDGMTALFGGDSDDDQY